jgi:hypothetical protein
VCLGVRLPSEAYDQIFITVRQLRICWCGPFSLTRGRVCHLQLLLILASASLGSESHGTRDHILPSQIWDFPFRRLLRLAGLRWRYSTAPSHVKRVVIIPANPLRVLSWPCADCRQSTITYSSSVILRIRCHGNSLPREQCLPSRCLARDVSVVLFWRRTSDFQASCHNIIRGMKSDGCGGMGM